MILIFYLKVIHKIIQLESTGLFKDLSFDIGTNYKQFHQIMQFNTVSNIYYLIKNNLIT